MPAISARRSRVWIGKAANDIITAASAYVPGGHAFASPRFIADRTPVEIGPFRITPYLVDHSAFDAYALLVEADGKRVFYSGDFRAHGRKKALFEAMVNRPPGNLDILLMEGTTIGRAGTSEGFATETDLEREFVQTFKETARHPLRLDLVAEHRPPGHDLPRGEADRPRAPDRPLHRRRPRGDR